jgi:hypothetical protein
MSRIVRYLLNIAIWLDIGLNVLIFSGSPHETISSRVGKQAGKGAQWACVFCKLLDKILGPEHCKNSILPDLGEGFTWWR